MAQGALTAASKTTNRLTCQKCFIKLVKLTLKSEHLNLDRNMAVSCMRNEKYGL